MAYVHDLAKIIYVQEGYLPNIPYHLISDKEMIDAFINNSYNYFDDMYPCPSDKLSSEYDKLKSDIRYHLEEHISDEEYEIPDWVYSYMIGSTIGQNSETADKHDLLVSLNCDNVDDVFSETAANECYKISKEWIRKLPMSAKQGNDGNDHRPPTMFGEPHVIKSIRLTAANYTGG